MCKFLFLLSFLILFAGCKTASTVNRHKKSITIPAIIKGDFKDDYDISYSVNDSLWIQHPDIMYHILAYNDTAKYFIVKNDAANPSEAGLYSRIDIMNFTGMEPYAWGFCLTIYDASSFEQARDKASADRSNPKKGCGGFPFSRMKRATP